MSYPRLLVGLGSLYRRGRYYFYDKFSIKWAPHDGDSQICLRIIWFTVEKPARAGGWGATATFQLQLETGSLVESELATRTRHKYNPDEAKSDELTTVENDSGR